MSREGSTAPNSRRGSIVPSSCRDSTVPSSRGESTVPVSRAGFSIPTSRGASIPFPCTSVSSSRNGLSIAIGSLPGSQVFSQDPPSRMTHAPQHLLSSDEQHPSHRLSVGLNSDEEKSQLPDEYYRARAVVDRDDFPFDSTQPRPPSGAMVSIVMTLPICILTIER